MIHTLRVATRKSKLALWQACYVIDILKKNHPLLSIEIVELSTQADECLSIPLYEIGGKGLFVKSLEKALIENVADIAVHSMKDVPTCLPENLTIAAVCERADPRDVLVSNHYTSIETLPLGATVGTTSLRRQSQLLCQRPDLNIKLLRGNINTRLSKLDSGQYEGIILAAAGLLRLGFEKRITQFLDLAWSVPASGQGVLGIEMNSDRSDLLPYLKCLQHPLTHLCVSVERAVLLHLNAGCESPIGSYAKIQGDRLLLHVCVGDRFGSKQIESKLDRAIIDIKSPQEAGYQVAKSLLDQGAALLLA